MSINKSSLYSFFISVFVCSSILVWAWSDLFVIPILIFIAAALSIIIYFLSFMYLYKQHYIWFIMLLLPFAVSYLITEKSLDLIHNSNSQWIAHLLPMAVLVLPMITGFVSGYSKIPNNKDFL